MPRVEEFPDGGRATLVRRYSPPLTKRQLTILVLCPYDIPGRLTEDANRRTARELLRYRLVEKHPDAKSVYRCTAAGAEVVDRWRTAGLLP